DVDLKAVMLAKLKWAVARKGAEANAYVIDIQILDASGAAVKFTSFAIELSVTLRATLKLTPDQPQERLGSEFKVKIQFNKSDTGQLNVKTTDLKDFNPARHDPKVKFIITVPAYP